MMKLSSPKLKKRRRGAVAVELAAFMPFLVLSFFVALDYCRIFYFVVEVQNAACAGALYGCQDSTHAANTDQIRAKAQADASNLSPAPDVTSATGTDADGNPTVSVTVTYTFRTMTNYPVLPTQVNLTRTVKMRVCP